jgi:AraC-like DNA-binding protein
VSFQSAYWQQTYSGFELQQAFDVVYGGHFEHRLLSARKCEMTHQRLVLGDVRLETGCYDFPVIARGSMPRETLCIGFMADGADGTRCNTTAMGDNDIQIYPAGVELLYHASAASRWVNFHVSEEQVQETALRRMGRPLELPRREMASVCLQPHGRAALIVLTNDALDLAWREAGAGGFAADLASTIGEALVEGYVDALCDAAPARKAARSPAEERHHQLILACERLVLTGEAADFSLADIARRSGYSQRSLQLIFKSSVGMTPGRWFMNARLNGALRDLLSAAPPCTVAAVAAKWGFRHLPRFSQYYRSAFGEMPSETLKRTLH